MTSDRFKFRVWCKTYNEWEKNSSMIGADGLPCWTRPVLAPVNMNNHIVEQCTGLKDKNGKLIYEGDVVASKTPSSMYQEYGQPEVVRWSADEAKFTANFGTYRSDCENSYFLSYLPRLEVIGNIHENPELLEG